jgi:hypothetical protein
MPSLHSSLFYPRLDPALGAGVIAMTACALDLLKAHQ